MPSVKFFGLQSFVCWLTCGLLGYPQPSTRSISISDEVLPTNRPPFLANRVHSLLSAVFFEVPSPLLPATPFGLACPAGVSSLFATSPGASTRTREHPLPLRSVLRFLQPLDGFLRLRPVGLLHPTATSRVLTVQGFLSTRSRPDSSPGWCPLAVVGPTTHRPRSAATIG